MQSNVSVAGNGVARAVVARPRLEQRLAAATELPLTVITGPAGTGKTVLLGAYGQRVGAAWETMRREHADPARLWRDIAGALSRSGLRVDSDPPEVDGVAEAVVRAVRDAVANGAPPPLLILDDLDRAGAPAAGVVEALLNGCGDALRIVVASRAEPALPLPRMRIEGRLAELRAIDLAFTEEEAGALLRAAGCTVSADQVARLVARTEGWAAALRLAAMALQGGEDVEAFLASFGGDDWSVGDYLVGEMLDAQDPDLRRMLVHTSILERVSGELVDALTGRSDGADALHALARGGCLIVPLDRQGHWFRYHGLLAELLRSRLRLEGPAVAADLHTRAATWLAEHGHGREALSHLAHAEPSPHVDAVLADHWVDLLLEAPPQRAMPTDEGQLAADARMQVALGSARLEAGDVTGGLRHLDETSGAPPLVEGVAALLRARARRDVGAARRAAHRLDEPSGLQDDRVLVGDGIRLLVRFELGVTEFEAGAREEAARRLEAAAALARQLDHTRVLAECLGRTAVLELLGGRLAHAERTARSALGLFDGYATRERPGAAWAYVTLAAVGWLRDEREGAEGFSDLAVSTALATRQETAAAAGRAVRGHLMLAEGLNADGTGLLRTLAEQAVGAPLLARWLDALGPRPDADADDGAHVTALDVAVGRLEAGDHLSALRRVEPLLDPQSDAHVTTRVWGFAVAAVAHQGAGQPRSAHDALEQALELASFERVLRPFVAGGPALRRLLERHADGLTPFGPLAGELLSGLRRAATPDGAPLEDLSARERQVLRLLPTLMSSADIGAELFVSVNTVKTHTRSIYRKLDVSSRRAAVLRAQQLGLL